jgi:hypothetical protein
MAEAKVASTLARRYAFSGCLPGRGGLGEVSMKVDRLWITACVLASVTLAGAARADVLPPTPASWLCQGKNVGDPCEVRYSSADAGEPGTCQVPASIHHCVSLDAGLSIPQAACEQRNDGDPCDLPPGVGGSSTPISGTCRAVVSSSATLCVPNTSAKSDDEGCAVGATSAHRTFGTWLLASAFAALVTLLRRRRR